MPFTREKLKLILKNIILMDCKSLFAQKSNIFVNL